MTCPLCREDVPFGEMAEHPIYNEDGIREYPHWYCMLREVLGGIGHFEDHAHWCGTMHDPDMGLSYRESARRVGEWVERHGVAAASERSIQQEST